MLIRCGTLALIVSALALPGFAQQEVKLSWSAEEMFRAGTSSHMILQDGKIALDDRILIEDDAPACGYSADPSAVEIIMKGVVLKKVLILDRLPVRGAWVAAMVYPDNPPNPNNGRHLVFTVNGRDIPYEVKHFWTSAPVPPEILREGENEILVRVLEPDARFKTWIALEENFKMGSSSRLHHPNRSSRSTDGGLTWSDRRLGVNGKADGEYPIRLALEGYQGEGWIESPVIDAATNGGQDILNLPVQFKRISITTTHSVPAACTMILETRSGSTLSPESGGWSTWESSTGALRPGSIRGRFLQLRLRVSTSDPMVSPSLERVNLLSEHSAIADSSLAEYRIVKATHFPLIRSSFTWAFELPGSRALRDFRSRMHLDRVAGDARTEFERMLRIKGWVARQWEWHLLRPEQDIFEWDANVIMTPGTGGKVEGGFCLHYAIVLMQALQSFGIPARVVSVDCSVWGGHEVVEAWSNEFGKWVFLDANFDLYFADRSTGVPLNVLEMHQMLLKEYFPGELLDRDAWSREDLVKRTAERAKPELVVGVLGGNARSKTLTSYAWWRPPLELSPYCGGYGPLVMGYLRYMPRANFLSQPRPIPVNHGRTHWGWTGYYSWFDQQTPRAKEHANFTDRVSDLYCNLNQIDFRATVVKSGLLRVSMAANAPYLAAYEVVVNGATKRLSEPSFDMRLERGVNRLEMRIVDSFGNRGTASTLECVYLPETEQQ